MKTTVRTSAVLLAFVAGALLLHWAFSASSAARAAGGGGQSRYQIALTTGSDPFIIDSWTSDVYTIRIKRDRNNRIVKDNKGNPVYVWVPYHKGPPE